MPLAPSPSTPCVLIHSFRRRGRRAVIDLHTMLRSSTWSQGGWSKSAAVYYLLFWVAAADSALQLHQADQLSQQHRTDQQPNQIHLAYGSDESITISWSTAGPTLASCVQYEGVLSGADAAPALACGRSKRFEDRGPEGYVQVLHSVELRDLTPGVQYTYVCGAPGQAWSEEHSFIAKRQEQQFSFAPLKLLVFGDMGTANSQVMPDLLRDAATGGYDGVLAVGDFAYDLQDDGGHRGDLYMRMLEPLAASLPFMTCPGNHEAPSNFSHYRHRFDMPGQQSNTAGQLFYSWNIGPVHIISYNTEVFFFPDVFDHDDMQRQYSWLEQDLVEANKDRAAQPWIIVMGHRPMYCTVAVDGRCDGEHEASRLGIPSSCPQSAHLCASTPAANEARYPVEDLFHLHGVDLALFGHVHDYERFWPTYNLTAHPGCTGRGLHRDPSATVHVTTGAAGNDEMVIGPLPPPHGPCTASAPWCAFQSGYYPQGGQSADYSYSRLTVHNASHLHWAQWSTTLQRVVDEWWIEQHHHGPFPAAAANVC